MKAFFKTKLSVFKKMLSILLQTFVGCVACLGIALLVWIASVFMVGSGDGAFDIGDVALSIGFLFFFLVGNVWLIALLVLVTTWCIEGLITYNMAKVRKKKNHKNPVTTGRNARK